MRHDIYIYYYSYTVLTQISLLVVVGDLAEGKTVCGSINPAPLVWGLVDWYVAKDWHTLLLIFNRVAPMMYGVILMSLALFKGVEFRKMSFGFKGFNLVHLLIQDQLIYFVLLVNHKTKLFKSS